jgi:septal ring factor EnvC (AmiA/AmiB activator)
MSKDNECFEDLTLKEYYQKLEYKEKYEALNRIRESIAEKQKEIEELKNHEENLKKELGL